MTVALGTNIANPISTALSQWPGFDTMGKLANYGKLGAAVDPDAVIEALFANSEVGAWYDPSDLSTMFQDSAGTTPVTAAGQSVRRINDKSGNGYHLYQHTNGVDPAILGIDGFGGYYLDMSAAKSNFSTSGNISLSSKNKATLWVGAQKGVDTSAQVMCEFGTDVTANNGSFGLFAPLVANNRDFILYYRGTSAIFTGVTIDNATGANSFCWTTLAIDGAAGTVGGSVKDQAVSTSSGAGAANFGNYRLFVGSRAGTSYAFTGKIYGIILRFAESSVNEKYDTNQWIHGKTYPLTTPVPFTNPNKYNKVDTTDINGQAMMIMVPNTNSSTPWDVRTQPKAIIYSHGIGETQNSLVDDTLKTTSVAALLDAGYILSGSNANGENFGNSASLSSYKNLYDYLILKYNPVGVALWGQSMGGLAATNILNHSTFPSKGILLTYPMLNLQYEHTAGTFTTAINTAYGITGVSPNTYSEKTSGSDPCLYAGSAYSGKPMRFYASPSDTIVTKTNNTDVLKAIVNSYVPESVVVVCSGQHGDASHFVPSEYVSFFGRCFS